MTFCHGSDVRTVVGYRSGGRGVATPRECQREN